MQSGNGKFELRTFQGISRDDQVVEYETLEDAIRGMLERPYTDLPKVQRGGKTLVALDPEGGRFPVCLDPGARAVYKAIELERRRERTPTVDQCIALAAFRSRHGADWKEQLNTCWWTGNYRGVDANHAALLQQVRNRLGPAWLEDASERHVSPPTSPLLVVLPEEDERALNRLAERYDYARILAVGLEAVEEREAGRGGWERVYHVPLDHALRFRDAVKAEGRGVLPEMRGTLRDEVRKLLEGVDGENRFVVSVYEETWTKAAQLVGAAMHVRPLVERIPMDEVELTLAGLGRYGVSRASSPDLGQPYVWFASDLRPGAPGSETLRGYALHVHVVNDREPTRHDYEYIASTLGITLSHRPEYEFDEAPAL